MKNIKTFSLKELVKSVKASLKFKTRMMGRIIKGKELRSFVYIIAGKEPSNGKAPASCSRGDRQVGERVGG